MLSASQQDILRHKVRGKLFIQRPKVPHPQVNAAADKAVLELRENDDWLFDMLVDCAVRVALKEVDSAAA